MKGILNRFEFINRIEDLKANRYFWPRLGPDSITPDSFPSKKLILSIHIILPQKSVFEVRIVKSLPDLESIDLSISNRFNMPFIERL